MISLFLKNNWEAIAVAVIVGFLVLSFTHIKSQRDTAIKDLNELKAIYNAQVTIANKNLADATVNQKQTEAVASKQIEDLNIDKSTLTNAIRGYYETKSIKHPMGNNTSKLLPPTAGDRTAETSTSAEGSATGESVTDTTCTAIQTQLSTLEDACALTTIYFNEARARVNQDCIQIGCE
jgi:hypothetical protein